MKKTVLVGQPAYMGQYTSLMIIILAFFILLQSMSTTQESGFQKGIGQVKNAFGLTGGMGLFQFISSGSGGADVPNPHGTGDKSRQGTHENIIRGEGGVGNTSADVEDSDKGRYLQVDVPIEFPEFKTFLTPEIKRTLDKFKVGFILYDYKLMIKCYSSEYNDFEKDNHLALQRAANIMRYIHETAGISYSRMEALGNSSTRYYNVNGSEKMSPQETFFYIFEKNRRRK
jgi:flagellar motor protein MotB